jgi:hypothetical protein
LCLHSFLRVHPFGLPTGGCRQGVVISGLTYVGVIQETQFWTVDEISAGLQDFLITIEMGESRCSGRPPPAMVR